MSLQGEWGGGWQGNIICSTSFSHDGAAAETRNIICFFFGWHSSCICRGCHGSNHDVFNAQFFAKPPESINNVWNCILQGSQVNQKHPNTVHKQKKEHVWFTQNRELRIKGRDRLLCDLVTCLSRRL